MIAIRLDHSFLKPILKHFIFQTLKEQIGIVEHMVKKRYDTIKDRKVLKNAISCYQFTLFKNQ